MGKLLIAGLLVLVGCVSPEERDTRACGQLGIGSDDPRFDRCLDRMEARREAGMAASLGMLSIGTGMLAPTPATNVYVH